MVCTFCGSDTNLTKEHVFPEWVRPFLQHPAGKGTHTRSEIRAGREATSSSRRDEPATWTVRSVCADCNNGWMSDLEESAKPHLLPLIEGRNRTLYGAAQVLVATWGVKTALVAGSKFEPRIPADFYREFYGTRRPSGQTRAWLAHAPHLEAHTLDWRPMKTQGEEEEPPERHNGFQAVMSVGHLAMYLVGWQGRKPPLHKVFDRFERALVKAWPAESPTKWPPRATITLNGLDDLADALGGIPPTLRAASA